MADILTLSMDWINIHTSVIDSAEFLTAEPVQRSTWLCLYRYCAGQENRGRILGAKAWTDRIWLQMCGVSLKEVKQTCSLWEWDGDDLVLQFYNIKNEEKVQRLRGQAANAGHASWQRRGLTAAQPTGEPHGSTLGIAKGKETERKGKEGNEIPPTPRGMESHPLNGSTAPRKRTSKAGSVVPSEQPEPVRGRMEAVGAVMRRQAGTPWTAREFEAFTAARLPELPAPDFDQQVETLRGYYHAKIPREINGKPNDFRRRDLQTLLNNWPSELDRARAYRRENNDGINKL